MSGPDPSPDLFLSAFGLELSTTTFRGRFEAYAEETFDGLSARDDIFVTRLFHRPPEEQVLVVPLVDDPSHPASEELAVTDYLIPIARLIATRLSTALPELKLEDERMGLFRVKKDDDLVRSAYKSLGIKPSPLLARLHKYARTHFKVRSEHLPDCPHRIWLAVEFDRKYQIDGTARDLVSSGASLVGLDVLRLDPEENASSYLGTVKEQGAGTLTVVGEHGLENIDAGACRVEPCLRSFQRLLRSALSASDFEDYLREERRAYAAVHCGDGYIEHLKVVHDWLAKKDWLEIAPALRFRVGATIEPSFYGRSPSAVHSRDILYCFSPDRSKTSKYPTSGLEQYGPFDSRMFDKKEPRIWIVYPKGHSRAVETFAEHLFEGLERSKRFSRGLRRTFHLQRIYKQFTGVDWADGRHATAADYITAMKAAFNPTSPPALALVVLRDEDTEESDALYLGVKAFLLGQGIPSQEAKLSKITATMHNLPFILETMAVAIYAKLGGTPWTVAPSVPTYKELIFGMAYAEFGGRFRTRKRYTGIATVFNSDGTYLLTATSPRCKYEEYTEKLAETVYLTLRRLAEEYDWLPDDLVRIVFHTAKPLTRHDIEAVLKAARGALKQCGIKEVAAAFLTIRRQHPFTVVDRNAAGCEQVVERIDGRMARVMVGQRYPRRGTVINLGRRKRLLCVGSAQMAMREDEGLPHPIQIELHRDSNYDEMTALVRQVYEFTGLSWKTTKPITEPVTIAYSRMIADMMTRLESTSSWNDSLLDTRLQRSRWFL